MHRPEVVSKIAETHATEAFKKNKSRASKKAWRDPGYRESLESKRREQFTPEVRAKLSAARKAFYASAAGAEDLQNKREQARQLWQDPTYQKRVVRGLRRASGKISEAQKQRWAGLG